MTAIARDLAEWFFELFLSLIAIVISAGSLLIAWLALAYTKKKDREHRELRRHVRSTRVTGNPGEWSCCMSLQNFDTVSKRVSQIRIVKPDHFGLVPFERHDVTEKGYVMQRARTNPVDRLDVDVRIGHREATRVWRENAWIDGNTNRLDFLAVDTRQADDTDAPQLIALEIRVQTAGKDQKPTWLDASFYLGEGDTI